MCVCVCVCVCGMTVGGSTDYLSVPLALSRLLLPHFLSLSKSAGTSGDASIVQEDFIGITHTLCHVHVFCMLCVCVCVCVLVCVCVHKLQYNHGKLT